MLDKLHKWVELAEQVMAQAHNPDGTVRLTKTAMAAAELLRRSLESGVRMAEAMRQVAHIDEFHAAILDEIAKEAPACAERLVRRLHHIASNWRRR